MFFLSWNGKPMPKPQGRKLFLPVNHKAFRLEDAVLSTRKSPFFSLVSPKGTLLAFLHALKQEGTEEARGYLSSAISGADLEELKGVFAHAEKYRFFVKGNRGAHAYPVPCGGRRKRSHFRRHGGRA